MHTVGAIIVGVCLVGCGGGDDDGVEVGADCSFEACGGDPVGEWTIDSDSICPEPSPIEDCPEATIEQNVDAIGHVTLADDGTFTMEVSYTGELVLHTPLSCIDGPTCADGDTPELDLTCENDGPDQCRCVSPVDNQDSEDGTWETDGDAIALLDSSDVVIAGAYCARGDQLVIRSQESPMPYTWILTR